MANNDDAVLDTNTSNGPELASLKQQRATMKRNISCIQKKIEKDGDKADTTILQCRLEILESYFKQICHIQGQIEKLCPSDATRGDLEEIYIGAKAKILYILNKSRCSTSIDSSYLNTSIGLSSHNRLPSLKLPRFDGKYADYKRFISTFNNMVHENSSLSPVDKFNYLLNCLSGQALAVVQPYQVTEENYPKALDRLKERYDNKVLIFLEHITNLFNISEMVKGDSVSLRNIIDTVSAIRGSLLSLGSEIDVMNAIIIHMVLSKLDESTKQNYDEKIDYKSLPSWETCYEILSHRCQFLESHGKKGDIKISSSSKKSKSNFNQHSTTYVTSNSNISCSYCSSAEHYLATCSSFLSLVVSERFNFIKRNGHCINCLRKGHLVSKCPSKSRCRICQSAHHTTLHIFVPVESSSTNATPIQFSNKNNAVSLVTRSSRRAIIPTAVVLIKDNFGCFQPVRVLLDSCSEINFITEEVAKRLNLRFQPSNQEVSGIGDVHTKIKFSVAATIKSRLCSYQCSSKFAVTKSISAKHPGEYIDASKLKIPETIELADPFFYKPQRIDLLISSEIFFDMLLDGRISLGLGNPNLINTVFGWIVGGKFSNQQSPPPVTCILAVDSSTENIESTLKRFWEVEEYNSGPPSLSEEEEACEKHFIQNTQIGTNGRIQVRLPFKQSPDCLGESFENCKRRFLSLERRLDRDSTLKSLYVEFMNEYIALGHMSPLNSPVYRPHYIIPHHCVLKPHSTTTKLRVVFDGSARTTSNHSLNNILMVGATIQQDLITTLFSFRLNRFALTADVSKMYRQFLVDDRDRKFQLILWRSNTQDELCVFQLNTVTYGLSAAPFLAIRSLFFIADQHSSFFPIGSKVLREDLYVDDVLTGSDSLEMLAVKRAQIIKILSAHGLQLAKWNSNCKDFVNNSEEVAIKGSEDDITKTLGMVWNPSQDIFLFRYDLTDVRKPTKRSILSNVAKIFDMLGLLSPIVIRCKILLQELWVQNIGWDDPLPSTLANMWLKITDDFEHIRYIKVPRYVFTSENKLGEIHGFADASQRAFGCCLYYCVAVHGSYKSTLLIAKSKVAPIKAQSLPRLELCAAILLSRTWSKIQGKISKFVSSVFFWTDSKIVLQWLKMHSSTLNCFVANRISELQQQTRQVTWRHVPSKMNPADIVSRGCSAVDLSKTIWFTGPEFLCNDPENWPENINTDPTEILEKRKTVVFKCTTHITGSPVIDTIIDNHSSYYKIVRILTYVFRISYKRKANLSLKVNDIIHLAPDELDNTFWRIVSHIQSTAFAAETQILLNNNSVQPSIQKLAPFIDEMKINNNIFNIIRVGGRLSKAPIPFDARFPALLPKNHRFVKLYIEHLHRLHLHAGPKVLIGILRQRVWIVNAREVVRKVVRNCTHCFHYKPKLIGQIMGNLPVDRLRAQRPFLVTGVDFCGPFLTSYRIRGKAPYKTYIAVFVCFSSKATHFELVSDLSTNNFILCLKRFVSRRGLPQRIFCDNATNFAGAHNQLKELKENLLSDENVADIKTHCSINSFEFCFIPPRAPHFGGLWEAAVKSAKTLLIKNVAQARLSFEELQTLVVEIEAILNSRPIAPMSDDPNDGEALTPGHFLIGSSLVAIPQQTLGSTQLSVLNRWQQISFLKNQFWQLWSRDYLHSLQQRSKWSKVHPDIKIDDLVIIHEDNTPPQRWLLARVTKTIAGTDGHVRVVELKTANGSCRRPIHKVAPLPSSSDF